jgi:hypothetical protein
VHWKVINQLTAIIQQDTQFILSENCSTRFGWYHHPSSEAHKLYLQHLVFVTPLLQPAAIMKEIEVPTLPR